MEFPFSISFISFSFPFSSCSFKLACSVTFTRNVYRPHTHCGVCPLDMSWDLPHMARSTRVVRVRDMSFPNEALSLVIYKWRMTWTRSACGFCTKWTLSEWCVFIPSQRATYWLPCPKARSRILLAWFNVRKFRFYHMVSFISAWLRTLGPQDPRTSGLLIWNKIFFGVVLSFHKAWSTWVDFSILYSISANILPAANIYEQSTTISLWLKSVT